jgi:hypothetical protein
MLGNSFPGPSGLTDTTEARKAFAGLIVKNAAGVARAGVFPAHLNALVTSRADMNVDIAAFTAAAVQFGGPVLLANDGVVQLPAVLISPAAGINYYVVFAKQNESTSPGTDADNLTRVGVVVSQTSFAVARATLPAGALELATVEMPSGKTATNQSGVVISQTHQYTAAQGGTVVVRNSAEADAWTPHDGAEVFQLSPWPTPRYRRAGAWSAPDTDWTATGTLNGGWSHEANNPVQFRRVNSIVEFRGRATSAGSDANMFGLPSGFRPPAGSTGALIFAVDVNGASINRVYITPTGVVQGNAGTGISFASIRFSTIA